MPGKFAVAAKTVLKHRRRHAGFSDKLINTVAHIAPGDAAFRATNASRRAAVIGGGDDAGKA